MALERDIHNPLFDPNGELPQDDSLIGEDELRQAGDVISAFVKAIKAMRFYPADNPLAKSFVNEFFTVCRRFLADYPIFVLQIGESTFSYDDRVLYSNDDWKSSLPFVLYNDGLRELRFHHGIENWELQQLLELIGRSYDLNPREDDLVIMLWEQDFIHVDYLALDHLQEEGESLVPDSVDQFRQRLLLAQPEHEDDVEVAVVPLLPAGEQTLTPSPCYDPAMYTLSSDEVDLLREEVAAELRPTVVFDTVDILFEIVLLSQDETACRNAVGVLTRMLDAMVTLGAFNRAEALLVRARELLKGPELPSPAHAAILGQLFSEAAAGTRIERLGRLLQRGDHDLLEAAHRYLLCLTPEAIPPLVHLLEDSRDTFLRRMLCDVLAEIGRHNIAVFFPFLTDHRWYVIRNIVFILGRIGDPAALPRLSPLLDHSEPRVRQEVAQALGHLRDPRSVVALGRALEDDDEVTRSIAAFSLGKIGTPNALAYLLQIMQTRNFRKKSLTEMKAYFDGLGLIGSNIAVPVLKQLLFFRTLFGGERVDAIHRDAVHTLTMIGTPEARAVLTEGARSSDTGIRGLCESALHSLPTGDDHHGL